MNTTAGKPKWKAWGFVALWLAVSAGYLAAYYWVVSGVELRLGAWPLVFIVLLAGPPLAGAVADALADKRPERGPLPLRLIWRVTSPEDASPQLPRPRLRALGMAGIILIAPVDMALAMMSAIGRVDLPRAVVAGAVLLVSAVFVSWIVWLAFRPTASGQPGAGA